MYTTVAKRLFLNLCVKSEPSEGALWFCSIFSLLFVPFPTRQFKEMGPKFYHWILVLFLLSLWPLAVVLLMTFSTRAGKLLSSREERNLSLTHEAL